MKKKMILPVTTGQLNYEWNFLKTKLAKCDPNKLKELKNIDFPTPHPLFEIVESGITGLDS